MKNSRHPTVSLLRSLIREEIIRLDLPYTQGVKSIELGGVGSLAFKAGLTFLAGIAAIKGYIWLMDNKSAIRSFATNVQKIPGILANISDKIDILTSALPEGVRSRKLIREKGDTFKTRHGQIMSDDIDSPLIRNLQRAEEKNYITSPTIDLDSVDELRTSMTPMITDTKAKVESLVRAVRDDGANFPENFSVFAIKLDDVDPLADLDDAEKKIANKAMSDAVGTAIFNSIKVQTKHVIGEVVVQLDEAYKKGTIETRTLASLKDELVKISMQIAKDIEDAVKPIAGIIAK